MEEDEHLRFQFATSSKVSQNVTPSHKEYEILKSQFVTSSESMASRSQIATLNDSHMGRQEGGGRYVRSKEFGVWIRE